MADKPYWRLVCATPDFYMFRDEKSGPDLLSVEDVVSEASYTILRSRFWGSPRRVANVLTQHI